MTHVSEAARSASLRYYHRRAITFAGKGLTTRGKPFRRHPNFKSREARRMATGERVLKNWHRRAASNILAGLTTRGGQRVLRLKYFDAFVLAAEIEAAAAGLAEFFNEVPPRAHATCLQLAHHLAAIRRRLPPNDAGSQPLN